MRSRIALFAVLSAVALDASVGAQNKSPAPRKLNPTELTVAVPEAALDQQFQALSAMHDIAVEYSPFGSVQRLEGRTGIFISPAGREVQFLESADEIFNKLRTILAAKGTEKLILTNSAALPEQNKLILRLKETIRGVPVEASDAALEIDTATGEIVLATFAFVPDHGLPTKPKIGTQKAFSLAVEALEATNKAKKATVVQGGEPTLKYYRPHRKGEAPTLMWEVYVQYLPVGGDDNNPENTSVYVDAIDGHVIAALPSLAHLIKWPAWTAFNARPATAQFPTGLGQTTDSVAAATWSNLIEADSAWGTYGFGQTPRQIEVVVHYGTGYFNAGAERSKPIHWLYFGDGGAPGTLYQSGPIGQSRDAAAHEYGHSRLFDTILFNRDLAEPAAVEEFFADWSSVVADNFWRAATPDTQTWEIGEIYTQRPGIGARSWNSPTIGVFVGKDWYPTFRETGEAHSQSTILGLAYRLLVTGGLHPRAGTDGIPPIQVTPVSDAATARAIFRTALISPNLSTQTDFFQLRKVVETAADTVSPTARASVGQAFDAVGIGYACAVPPARPTLNVYDLMCGGRFFISWNSVPGATRYYAEGVRSTYPWSLANPIIDGAEQSCMVTIKQRTLVRAKACNACGCSPYTDPATLEYWPYQCP